MKDLAWVVAAWVFLTSSSAQALSMDEIRDAIKEQSAQRHPNPPPGFWEQFGPDALPVLKQMLSGKPTSVERTWIIEGLGHFQEPEVGRLLQEQVKLSANPVFTKKLLSSLIQSQGDLALDFVEPYLSDPDPHIRIAVARGMRVHMSSAQARERLRVYLAAEKEDWIKTRIAVAESQKKSSFGRVTVELLSPPGQSPSPSPSPEPLPEKDWAGEWKGVYLAPAGSGSAKGFLKKEKDGWRADLSLPKKKRLSVGPDEAEIQYFQTEHYHWIRIRVKKTDMVFTGNRKAN